MQPRSRLALYGGGILGVIIALYASGVLGELSKSGEQGVNLFAVAIGAIAAAAATAAAIFDSIQNRMAESKKRNLELIQSYDQQLNEILNQEKNLKTKLDCTSYVEQYLNALEQIASLQRKKLFEKDVTDYFENHFSYGIDLWRWYQKNIVKIIPELIGEGQKMGPLWKLPTDIPLGNDDDLQKFFLEKLKQNWIEYYGNKDFPKEFTNQEFGKNLLDYLRNERWKEFRNWCSLKDLSINKKDEILPLLSDFGYIQNEKERLEKKAYKKYRLLPEILYDTFEEIPEEDGLSKDELVGIIREFGNGLSQFVEKEKTPRTQDDCSVYAEQYLDTLEEIASLYRKSIIPRIAADYFENKFSYGRNLWDWYYERILKYSQDLYQSLWNMDDKKIEGDKNIQEQIREDNFKEFATHYQVADKNTHGR